MYGDIFLTRQADGTITVDKADDVILVAKSMLAHPDLAERYVDGVLTADTAGQYRYRRVREHDEHCDVFERVRDEGGDA